MSFSMPLVALGVFNPLLLSGLGLILVPIIIHWLFRRRYRRIDWAAIRFILEAERENRRRTRLEQWLLLALRILAMALLALLIARPFVEPGWIGTLLGAPGAGERLLVIDDSASLGYRQGARSDFAELTSSVARLLNTLANEQAGGPLTVFLTSTAGEAWYSADSFSASDAAEIVDRLSAHAPSSLPAAPTALFTQIAARLTESPDARRADLYVVADFQRTDWAPRDDESVFAPLRSAAEQLRVVLVPTVSRFRPNVALLDLQLTTAHAIAGQPSRVALRVANFSDQPSEPLTVDFSVDDTPLPALQLPTLQAGQTRIVEHDLSFAEPGYVVLRAQRSSTDSLPADDTRWLTVPVKAAVRVLLVNGDPQPDPARDDAFLLSRALAPPGQFSSGILVESLPLVELEGTDLSEFDCIMLCNVGSLSSGALSAVQQAVRQGVGLFASVGSETRDLAGFNRTFVEDGAGMLGGMLQRIVRPDEAVGLISDLTHPVTQAFPSATEGISEYVRFRQFTSAQPVTVNATEDDVSDVRILARFSDPAQSPALIESRYGRGRTLLFTSTVDLEWNNWAASVDGSYVITMLEAARYLARREAFPSALTAGERLAIPVAVDRFEPSVTIRPPEYAERPAVTVDAELNAVRGTDIALAAGPRLDTLGIWNVELLPRAGSPLNRPLSVNLTNSEADLQVAARATLAAGLQGVAHEFADVGAAASTEVGDQRRELWPTLLGLLFLVLFVEQFLAFWFGRMDRRSTRRQKPLWQM